MGRPAPLPPVQLIAGVLAASDGFLAEATAALARRFGPIALRSAVTEWNISTYYRDELGTGILRQFVALDCLLPADQLAAVKHVTNALEADRRQDTRRRVNLDPGYVGVNKLVLASTKDAAHRIYLGDGIYAEVTLEFCNGSFRAHRHTYPDYAAAASIAFFNSVRQHYLARLRHQRC